MSLRLLVDECIQSNLFVAALRKAGHDVETVLDANLSGQPDETIFHHAVEEDRVVITLNCIDFDRLAKSHAPEQHPGVLLVYSYNNPQRDMNNSQIIAAIENLKATKIRLTNQVIVLNQYNY